MKDFQLPFNLQACQKLDDFALLATQDYNLGGKGDWFGCFRGGLYGFYARIYGVKVHYHEVHSLRLTQRVFSEPEYHLSSIFFNMDSAVECFVFAMNALGYAVAPSEFLDVADEKGLRQVAPWNILGNKRLQPLIGYSHFFPTLQTHWQANQTFLNTIMEQHDVSKHRSTIYVGGKYRMDAPPGFFEALGICDDPGIRFQFSPMEEIILKPEPKTPPSKQTSAASYSDLEMLEDIAETFGEFINVSCVKAYEDSIDNIKSPHDKFLEQVGIVYQPDVDLYEDAECTKKREGVTGVMLATEITGYGISGKSIVPTTRLSYYQKRKRISQDSISTNFENVWGEVGILTPTTDKRNLHGRVPLNLWASKLMANTPPNNGKQRTRK